MNFLRFSSRDYKIVQVEVCSCSLADTTNCELQWKIARAARDLSCLSSTSKEKKKELTYEGLECAQNAVNSDGSNFSAHKVG